MGLIADPNMEGMCVSLRIDRNGAHAQALGASSNAAGNLAAVGDQNGVEHAGPSVSPILARGRGCRLSLWTFWRHRWMSGGLFRASRAGMFFFFWRGGLGIHDADRRN